ncbi:MAG: esterase [Devosia sp.]|nr:alpha/beta hydrolase [Devosia sp.]MDB5587959.1 esterase [Devosia sp.]
MADGDCVTVDDMVDHALAALSGTEGPWIVVGHSGGGIVATMVVDRLVAGQPGSAAGLVYLTGMMLPSGIGFPAACKLVGAPPQGIEPFLQPTADGLVTLVPPEAAAEIFFQCADPADARAAAARLIPQLNPNWMTVPHWTAEGAGSVPGLYIEALQDRSMPIAVQRTMQLLVPGARIETIDTDHAPQLPCPDRAAYVLLDFASGHL